MSAKYLLYLMYMIFSWAIFYAKIFSNSRLSKEQAESKNCTDLYQEEKKW